MTLVYIAGPMTGRTDYNYPAFRDAADRLRVAEFDVLDPSRRGVIDGWEWSDYLRAALRDVVAADVLALLPEWGTSKGARLEVHVARELGIPQLSLATVLTRGPEGFADRPEIARRAGPTNEAENRESWPEALRVSRNGAPS